MLKKGEELKRIASGIIVVSLFLSLFTFAFDIQLARANGGSTIYIRADGSIDPPTAPIQRDGETYTFTGNINGDGISVGRNNTIIDGAGYVLSGTEGSSGFYLNSINNVTIRNTYISGYYNGIYLRSSANNIVFGNVIANNYQGLYIVLSSGNVVHDNNFTGNAYHALTDLTGSNAWDDGYPSGGNYWSGYTDVDLYSGPNQDQPGSDGIWDHPYVVDANNQDRYPLVSPILSSIGEVRAFYTLDSFFLGNMAGLVPPNQYFVKGTNIDRVKFSIYVNGIEQVYMDLYPDSGGWFSSEEYDMGGVTSDLTITAFNSEGEWVQETVDTHVFETPFWLSEIIALALENEHIRITTEPGSGFGNVWKLSATFQWPQKPFEGGVDLSYLPLIGGNYNVSASFGFGLSLASDKTVTAKGSGSFKVTIADQKAGADIEAEATIRIADSIVLEDFVINVRGNIMIPIKQKYKWDVWRYSIGVEVGVNFEADASFSFHIQEAAGEGTFCDGFDWVRTANDIRFTLHPYASASVGIGELRIDGEGVITFTVHVPEPYFTYPDDLNVQATVKLTLKTFLHTWEWTVLKYSSGSPVEWSVNASGSGWINRTWATENYSQYVWMENTTAGIFLENVYSYANPSVAASSDTVMMVWTHDDLSKPYIQGYEVYYSLWNPETGVWSPPSPVTNNTIPEDAASVQFDASGNAVAVWTQINNASLSESMDPFSLLNQTELAYAVWNHTTGLWTEPFLITNNYAYDYSPLLVSDPDGNLMLAWLADQDCNLSTLEDLSIYSSTWNIEQWSSPAFVASPGLISSPIQAACHQGEAVVIWSADTDGNATTLNDTELFYCQFSNGNWDSKVQLTMNDLEETEPSVAIRHGHPVFAWVQRNETGTLMFLDPEEGSPRPVLERLGVSSPKLSVDGQNHTLLVWADSAYETPYSFSLTPGGCITFVELPEQSSQRNIYCKTLPYQNVIVGMSDSGPVHVIDLDAQVSVSNLTSVKTVVCEGQCDQVNVTIANQGYFTQPLNVTFCSNSTTIYEYAGSLQGGTATTLTFTWNTTGFARGNYTLSAIAKPVLGEAYTADNNLTGCWVFIAILGDINGDGKVDVKDVYRVALAYGTSSEGPNPPGRSYNPYCDINNDYKVDVKDYYIVCKYYGEVDP